MEQIKKLGLSALWFEYFVSSSFENFKKQALVLNHQRWISEVRSIVLSGLIDPQRQASRS